MENSSYDLDSKFAKNSKAKTSACLLIILVVSFLVILPIFLNGIPYGNDLKQHYQFASSIDNAITTGDYFPNWAANENNGYGGVGLRFYPPISYYVLSAFKIAIGNWYDASVLAFTFWMFLGGIGIFFWSKEFFTDRASLFAAILYILIPYHVIELYASFTYAEFAASGILPFSFLFITRICRNQKPIDCLLLAFSFAILVLTHLPLTVIGSISLAVFAIASSRFQLKKLLYCGSGILFGLLLSSFHWIRVVTEMSWINHVNDAYSASGQGIYDFRSNFLLSFPYLNGLENDLNSLWYLDIAIIATLVIVVPFAIFFFQKSDQESRNKLIPVFVLFAFAFLMMTKVSQPIWENLSFLQKVQFPWRWFSIVSIFAVVIAASGFEFALSAWKSPKRSQAILAFMCVLFCVVFTYSQVIRQTTHLDRNSFGDSIKDAGSATNYDCWLPNWTEKGFSENNNKVVAGNRDVEIIAWQPLKKMVKIGSGGSSNVRFAVLYYPHWKALINGDISELQKSADGAILLPISDKHSTIELNFIEPNSVQLGKTVSQISWLFWGIIAVYFLWKTLSKSKI